MTVIPQIVSSGGLLRFFPNPALRESPGLDRLVIDGPAHGHVLSDGYILLVGSDVYEALEIGVGHCAYRTWKLIDSTMEDHLGLALDVLIGLSPDVVNVVRINPLGA